MFTLLVSWLLVACIPVLLMLATLELGRLEKALVRDTAAAADGTKLEQAKLGGVRAPSREQIPGAPARSLRHRSRGFGDTPLPALDPGRRHFEPFFAADLVSRTEATLPTRIHRHPRTDPEYTVTRSADRM